MAALVNINLRVALERLVDWLCVRRQSSELILYGLADFFLYVSRLERKDGVYRSPASLQAQQLAIH
jgi:hypothetical protein